MKRILIVSPSFPYPADYGGGVDIWKRISSLVKLGYKVDLVATIKTQPDEQNLAFVQKAVNKVILVNRENKIADLFSRYPLQVVSRKKLQYIPLEEQYDITILEGDYVGLILENKALKTTHRLLRSHNDEKKYFLNLAMSSGIKINSLYYLSEFFKFKHYISSFLLKKVKKILFISSEELSSFNKRYKTGYQTLLLPTPVNLCEFKKKELTGKTVVFVGSMFMPNNQEAILWYLNNVHNALTSITGYKFLIAGSTRGHDVSVFVDKLKLYSSLEYHLDVLDLTNIYDRACVFVNPMLSGAGVKIKSINAIIEGVPLVSTRIGAEGIGIKTNEHYLQADTPTEFISSLKHLLNSTSERKRLAMEAQEFLIKNNHDEILKKFLNNLL